MKLETRNKLLIIALITSGVLSETEVSVRMSNSVGIECQIVAKYSKDHLNMVTQADYARTNPGGVGRILAVMR